MHTNYQSRHAITLAETVISTLLIAFVLVSTLQLVGPMARSTTVHADKLVAANLANELAEEIATKLFIDPDVDTPDDIGIDPGDSTFFRQNYDDIDDYDNWSSTPPEHSLGGKYTTLPTWTRSVKVVHVLLADPSAESATYTGLKKVTVGVSKNGTTLASITTLHSQTADTLGFIVPITSPPEAVIADVALDIK